MRRLHALQAHFGTIRVWRAIEIVMQVLKFTDAAIAGLEHFQVELRRNVKQVLGLDPLQVVVHDLAPGPETVFSRITADAGAFAKPRHGALMGVGMHVRDRRNQYLDPVTRQNRADHWISTQYCPNHQCR